MVKQSVKTVERKWKQMIKPQLERLKWLITNFFGLENKITSFCGILPAFNEYFNFISNHICQSLNTLISIDLNSLVTYYLNEIKHILNSNIYSVDIISSKSIKYISYIIRIIAFYFNILLQFYYKNFIKKLNDQKSSLEEKIKSYIVNINKNLNEHSSCVQKLIATICKDIDSLKTNCTNLSQFNEYDRKDKLIKYNTEFTDTDTKHFQKIFETHKTYKECLESDCSKITPKLDEFKGYLTGIKSSFDKLSTNLNGYKTVTQSRNIIDNNLFYLQYVKIFKLNKFHNYLSCVQKLQEIGLYIKTMKEELKKVESKVDEGAKTYIENLKEINISQTDVKSNIKEIKEMNNFVVVKLRIAKHTIEFYNSLESAIKNLSHVSFKKYDVSEFLKNSQQIQQKLTSFCSQIKEAINKIESDMKEINIDNHTIVVHGDTYDESYYKKLISPVQTLIFTTIQEISVIRYIIYYLKIIRSNSMYLNSLKTKIGEIKDIKTGLIKLSEILEYLKTFYCIHRNSMNTVILLNSISFVRHSINKYVDTLRLVKYQIEILIFIIKCYIIILSVIQYVQNKLKEIKPKIEDLKSKPQEIKKLEGYTSNIINSLESIQASLGSLKSVNSDLDINNLKSNLSVIKYHIRESYLNILSVNVNLNEIIKMTLKIIQLNDEVIKIQKTIKDTIIGLISFINYLYINYRIIILYQGTKPISEEKKLVFIIHSNSIFKMIENLFKILDYLDGINKVFDNMGIDKFINFIQSQISSTETLVKKIESNVDKMDKGVVDLECAIDGVVINFIRCSLQSNSNSTVGVMNNNLLGKQVMGMYSVLIVNQYNYLVNRMLEFWTFSDQSVELFKYIRFCICALHFETKHRDQRPSTFPYPLHSVKTRHTNPVSEFVRQTMADNVGNHLCLCLVIKYHLRPTLLKCILYLRNEELGTLDTISRKFHRYNKFGFGSFRWKLCGLVLNIIYELTSLLRNRYNFIWMRPFHPPEIKCFCTITNTIDYHLIVNITLYVSSLMENIWSMDPETVRMSIESLSTLVSELEGISSDNTHYGTGESMYKNIQNFRIFSDFKSLIRLSINGLVMKPHKQTLMKLFYNCIIPFFKSLLSYFFVITGLPLLSVAYSIISSLSFYIIANPLLIIKSIPTIVKTALMSISVKYLKCKQEPCTCQEKKGCKICHVRKIRYLSLSILMNWIRHLFEIVIKHLTIDTLSLTTKVKIEFVRNSCVSGNIRLLRMTKNNPLTSRTNDSGNNLNITDATSARNWGYDTQYEHDLTFSETTITTLRVPLTI